MVTREYQNKLSVDASRILQKYGLVYLAMEVRTGKTITSLLTAQLYFYKHLKLDNKVLFLTRKKAIDDIQSQYNAIAPSNYHMDIINYEQLHNVDSEYDLFICDEAHCLGAFPAPSNRAKMLKLIVKDKPVIYLSGTPTPESYSQIYHQFFISDNSPFALYKSFYKWAEAFVKVKKKYIYNREIKDYSQALKDKIDIHTRHLFISFSQIDAGFAELIKEEILYVNMGKISNDMATKLKRDKVIKNNNGEFVVADTASKLLSKIHQICSGTVIIDEPLENPKKHIAFDDTKAQTIKSYFRNQKIAIFYKYIAELEHIQKVFGDKITDSIQEFNITDKIYVSQIQSGREGINLSSADALVMYNIDYSAVSYFQARARLQTKDRIKPAKVYWVFSLGGIENEIYLAVTKKKDYTLEYFKRGYAKTL